MLSEHKRKTLPRLLVLAAVAAAAVASGALIAPDRAGAQPVLECSFVERVDEYQGYWAVFEFLVPNATSSREPCEGRRLVAVLRDANGNPIPVDQPKPGFYRPPLEPLNIRAIYDGDQIQVPTPVCVDANGNQTSAGCSSNNPGGLRSQRTGGAIPTWLRMVMRPLAGGAPPPPLVDQDGEVVYQADDDNRVVLVRRGSYRDYYREWRVDGRWYRSNTYGTDLLRAQWNAWLLSKGRPLIPISWLITSDPPPAQGTTDVRCQADDLPPLQRELLCAGN